MGYFAFYTKFSRGLENDNENKTNQFKLNTDDSFIALWFKLITIINFYNIFLK